MKLLRPGMPARMTRRSSHEERGLKSFLDSASRAYAGRSSHEERGLKFNGCFIRLKRVGRSSHEERGLKCFHPFSLDG